uniref:Uncharacterized protein n=1 Tax=Sphaerodactylus townsendi TaxID=933632 RepID=A0ACB8EYG1_9SAUR
MTFGWAARPLFKNLPFHFVAHVLKVKILLIKRLPTRTSVVISGSSVSKGEQEGLALTSYSSKKLKIIIIIIKKKRKKEKGETATVNIHILKHIPLCKARMLANLKSI